ncbi:PEP-CTERM sorting domain-containing protein [Nostoc sp.]|uniref:PEP-CTERM sorting domain-containing protein n=1 Tax=Nostoc sp. TaxID=1180 RepID=UPI002FFD2890
MKTKRKLALAAAISISFTVVGNKPTKAAVVQFIPPTDQSGQIFSTNFNDGYSEGRGFVFKALANTTINSVGILQDLTNTSLSVEIGETNKLTGNVTIVQNVLTTLSKTVTTNGLQWIDFTLSPLTFFKDNFYHIEFSFQENANQNFFYTQLDNPNFTQGNFAFINGTQGGNTDNFVIPAIRVNTIENTVTVPEPTSIIGSALALVVLGAMKLKNQQRSLLTKKMPALK